MKKASFFTILLVCLLLAACSSGETKTDSSKEESSTFTYESEQGPVEVPKEPKRIVALTNGPNVISLEGKLVGIDEWTEMNPLFTDKLKDVEVVGDDQLEKIIELDPDLIIAGSQTKNLDKMKEIAPTVAFTWGKLNYIDQQIEIGKLLNKEKEAKEWADDFQERAATIGEEIRKKIGDDATVSVIETGQKELYVFGNNYARGSEILYQAMKLNMPEAVKDNALETGIHVISPEAVSDFTGDYLVLSKNPDVDNSFMETDTWKNIPAVKNGHVIEINSMESTYSDPMTLEHLLKTFEDGFLEK
ncbi:ABC transporter substrate-binding protein [Rossellomorea marisflavi]|uniref:ABC transporter substrate-binding protein n=1 Tax=Rossellomorea marisflavi TaxID=189381 RepID=UPI00345A5650